MRCDQCKHWKEEAQDWELQGSGFRKCAAVRERWVIQDEASEGIEWDGEEEGAYSKSRRAALQKARAYVQDGSQYTADLCTGPDFGCVLFVPADQQKGEQGE